MKLKDLWERYRAQRRALTLAVPSPLERRVPKPFEPLTHYESIAVLEDAIQWLIDEARTTLAIPNSPSKDRRKAELRARDKSMARDFARLVMDQEG